MLASRLPAAFEHVHEISSQIEYLDAYHSVPFQFVMQGGVIAAGRIDEFIQDRYPTSLVFDVLNSEAEWRQRGRIICIYRACTVEVSELQEELNAGVTLELRIILGNHKGSQRAACSLWFQEPRVCVCN